MSSPTVFHHLLCGDDARGAVVDDLGGFDVELGGVIGDTTQNALDGGLRQIADQPADLPLSESLDHRSVVDLAFELTLADSLTCGFGCEPFLREGLVESLCRHG